ncbi:MAG TPA: HAD family hydrolase [Polyangiaceae bacterium]|jgi:FMN phosphatase YigB (HAD superfamily)|nr:HAD family hydrolase [Polyangiaceae bacterium]
MTDAQYDAWLVDLDGTLYTQRWVRLAMAVELLLLGQSAIKTLRQFRHEHEAMREEQAKSRTLSPLHESPFAGQLARTADKLGVPVADVERVVRHWMIERPGKWIRRFPRRSLLAELRAFKGQGGRTALVSDYPAARKIDALGVRSLFDVIVANGEADGPRRLKPDPEGYLHAAELLKVPPSRCLVIGDRDDADGEAARAGKMAFRLV